VCRYAGGARFPYDNIANERKAARFVRTLIAFGLWYRLRAETILRITDEVHRYPFQHVSEDPCDIVAQRRTMICSVREETDEAQVGKLAGAVTEDPGTSFD
jgi:hypothetical protein